MAVLVEEVIGLSKTQTMDEQIDESIHKYKKLDVPMVIRTGKHFIHDFIQNPRRILISGALRSGKDGTNAKILDTVHRLDPDHQFIMFSPPLKDLPDWIQPTLDLNDDIIWKGGNQKTLWINEGLLAINPQDWQNEVSKLFARKIPISSHKNLRLLVSSQSGQAIKVLINTASARIFKRMDKELMDLMFKSTVYLREFFINTERSLGRNIFQRLRVQDSVLDVGTGFPISFPVNGLPDWYTDRVSKNWEFLTDEQLKQITGMDKPALDYSDLKTQDLNKLDYISFMALHIFELENPDSKKGVSVDKFMAYVTTAGLVYNSKIIDPELKIMSKAEARNTLDRIKLLHEFGLCIYCEESNLQELKNRLVKMKEGKWFNKKKLTKIKAFI